MKQIRRTAVLLKRFSKNPGVRRAIRVVKRDVVRTTIVSLVPSAIDDTIVHHVQPIQEVIHVMSMSTLTAVATVLMLAAKL